MDPGKFLLLPPPPTEHGSRKISATTPPPTKSIRAKLGLPPPPKWMLARTPMLKGELSRGRTRTYGLTNTKYYTGLRDYDDLVRSTLDRKHWRIMAAHLYIILFMTPADRRETNERKHSPYTFDKVPYVNSLTTFRASLNAREIITNDSLIKTMHYHHIPGKMSFWHIP